MAKNIAILSTSYLPVQGGVQYLLWWLLKEIDNNYLKYKQKYNFDNIYFIIPKYNNSEFDDFKNINILYIDEIFSVKVLLKNMISMREMIKRYDISLIHAHNALIDGVLCYGSTLFNNCRYILTSHGIDFAYNKALGFGVRLSKIKEQVIGLIAKKALTITTVSSDMVPFINELVVKDKIVVIPNCYDNHKVIYDDSKVLDESKKLKLKYNIKENDNIYITLSGARKIKGHINMIKAFSKIQKKLQLNTKIFIAAHGDETEKLKQMVKSYNLEDSIFFIDFITGIKKEAFFKIASLYINTAFFEPFGLVYLEAIENNLAVLGSVYGGGKDIFEHKQEAYLSDPYNIDSIISGFIFYDSKNNIKDMVDNSKKLLSNYTVENIINKYLSLYMESLDVK